MNQRARRQVSASLAISVVLLIAAACSSSSAGKASQASTVPADTTPTTSVSVVPSPFEVGQRFGVGERWQITTANVKRSGTTITVALDVLNTGPDTATFDAPKPGLFKMLNEYPSTATPSPIQHAPASTLSSVQIPGDATRRVTVRFTGIPASSQHAVLWFRGHMLPGTIDASVWFNGV